MPKTSLHLKPCNIGSSETHNKREKKLDYVREDLSHLNESFSYIGHPLQTELANIRKEVKQKTGRKLQKNANPLKEGVIVISQTTTMEHLKEFCERCRQEFGMIPLQIHIHRDEGHPNAKEWKPNLHAHVVWRMYNENGRNVNLNRKQCSDMQTMLAECLQMERGQQSTKQHLSSLQFKIQKEEERAEMLESKNAVWEGAKEGVMDLFVGKSRKSAKMREKRAVDAENEVLRLNQERAAFERKVRQEAQSEANEILEEERKQTDEYLKFLEKDYFRRVEERVKQIREDYFSPELKAQSEDIGLSSEQRFDLAIGKTLNVEIGEKYGKQDIRWDTQKKSILAKAMHAMRCLGSWLKLDEWKAKFEESLQRNKRREKAPSEKVKIDKSRGRKM